MNMLFGLVFCWVMVITGRTAVDLRTIPSAECYGRAL